MTCSGSVFEGHKDHNKAELSEDKGGDTLLVDSGDTLLIYSADTLNMNSEDTLLNDSGDTLLVEEGERAGEREGKPKHDVAFTEILEEKEDEIAPSLHSEHCMVNGNLKSMEQDKVNEQPGSLIELDNQKDALAAGGALGQGDEKSNDKPLESETSKYVHDLNYPLKNEMSKPRIKKGRRCGLCGGGTDGKPPKILLQHGLGSDDESYSGSSDAEETHYDTWDGFGDEPGWLGRLLGPINDRFGIAGIWVHQHCAVWSPEVRFLY